MKKDQKAAIIASIKAATQDANIAVIADFKGMPVEEMTRLRVKLRESNATLLIVKNTLARIALEDGPHAVIKDTFRENCAIALGSEDPVAVAKAMVDFAKTSKTLVLRRASLEGKVLDTTQLDALAKLPSREVLLGQLLGTMNAVPTGLVSVLANTIRGVLYALKAIETKKAA